MCVCVYVRLCVYCVCASVHVRMRDCEYAHVCGICVRLQECICVYMMWVNLCVHESVFAT